MENRIIFALQTLFSKNSFKEEYYENTFKYNGNIPIIKFTPSEFLSALKLEKRKTSRGKFEYSSNERDKALEALENLSQKKYLFYYEKKYWENNKEKIELIKTIRPLINLEKVYKGLSEEESEEIKSGDENNEKITFYKVTLAPVFVDQLDTYFVLKPANCYQEIKLKYGKTSKYVQLFIDYLFLEFTQKKYYNKNNSEEMVIKISSEALSYKLRMDKLIREGKKNKINEELKNCFKIAFELGYIFEYKTLPGSEMEIFTLNPDKFYKAKDIEKRIKSLEEKKSRLIEKAGK